MKKLTFMLLLYGLMALDADAEVKLERLEDFDPDIHRIAVSIQVDLKGRCAADTAALKKGIEGLLNLLDFRTGSYQDSQLEFAVAVKGLKGSESQPCGLLFASMARQIPLKKVLRLSPGARSTRYRLWEVENVIMANPGELQALLELQAQEDLTGFSHAFERASGR